MKKFFTLYFIPLIPLGFAGDYVECPTCNGTFVSRVLDYQSSGSNSDFQSQYEKAMKHCMLLIMLADGEIDENEIITVQTIINKFGQNNMTLDELEIYIEEVKSKNENINTYLKKVTPSLYKRDKEIIIKCALGVAAADGHIDDSEVALIKDMAATMEMSASHLKGIFMDVMTPKETTFSENYIGQKIYMILSFLNL